MCGHYEQSEPKTATIFRKKNFFFLFFVQKILDFFFSLFYKTILFVLIALFSQAISTHNMIHLRILVAMASLSLSPSLYLESNNMILWALFHKVQVFLNISLHAAKIEMITNGLYKMCLVCLFCIASSTHFLLIHISMAKIASNRIELKTTRQKGK